MAVAAILIFDGKTVSNHWLVHLIIGAVVGFLMGCAFSRNHKRVT
jgi:hypothetical protein